MANGLAEVRRGSGLKNRHISGTAGIQPYKLDLSYKYAYDDFRFNPACVADAGGGAATGTTGDVNVMNTGGNLFEYHIKGTQTLVAPVLETDGLEVALDKTDNDGVEYTLGITSRSRFAFTAGTHAFYAKLKFKIADVSGTDDCAFGFRKAEAYQAAIDNYDEMACLNVISGNINIETILNNGSTTTTDTTDNWADGESHTLGVFVDLAGKVRYEIDGVEPTTTASFTFDSAEVVVPFFYFLQATTSPGKVHFQEFECGLLEADLR